ncbi:hypothetical protein C9374_012662 [Naegleria lovaniensis]|uniref:Fe2OG dioxygenase domain-containing protein n=1 Tax=Naegleria lovaniensis TaxID=51637 RepID=A0AA88KW95_NAELO|nr:uncharacterized protein C9374_012662 [Naegleria lovaniensis]KAG2392410.1 hypothetical protein C9374_012662 [Naegleria lovaniensis]
MISSASSSSNMEQESISFKVILDGLILITSYREDYDFQQELIDYCIRALKGEENSINGVEELPSLETPFFKCFLDIPFESFREDLIDKWCHTPLAAAKDASPILKQCEDKFKIVQLCYYTTKGKLGWHRDRISGLTEEEQAQLTSPVVSISLGNDCIFSYKVNGYKDVEHDLHLKSGDILIFSGPQRMMWHTVKKVFCNDTRPKTLNMRGLEGRINVTFREGTYYPDNSSPNVSNTLQ